MKAPVQLPDGTLVVREKGTPQGGVISPLLANLFLHYAFDEWMQSHCPVMSFERYADDIIVHCRSEKQAFWLKDVIARRLAQCDLELHPEKTKIVYCKDDDRTGKYRTRILTSWGLPFVPAEPRAAQGITLSAFCPAVSPKAARRSVLPFGVGDCTD